MDDNQLEELEEGEDEDAVNLDRISNAEMEAKIRAMKE